MEYQAANWPSKVCKERPLMTLDQTLSIIGLLTALYLLTRLAFHAHTYLRRSSLPHYLHPSTPTWAFITGATDGIGLGFAQELCQRGFNVILHGRNPKKLQDVQAQLAREYPLAKTKTVVFDASHPADGLEQRVREWIGDAELSVLINNVGGQGGLTRRTYQTLEESTGEDVDTLLNLNARFATQITRVLLPALVCHSPSLIMNISSIAALGLPYLDVYAGAKGYIDSFTRALGAEMVAEGKQVEVLGIQVGSVRSAGNDVDEGFFIPTSRQLAKAALERVGCGRLVLCAFWPHALQLGLAEMLPEKWMQSVSIRTIKGLKILSEEKEKRES